jgi:hypothetical protein
MRSRFVLTWSCCIFFGVAGCGSDTPADPGGAGPGSGASGGGGGEGGDGGVGAGGDGACEDAAADGSCIVAGIPGCAADFLDAAGVCRPHMELCEAGTIPVFQEGCVKVGIDACHADFADARVGCRPSMELCPEGTFAVPTQGCVPIDGPSGCGGGVWGDIPDQPGTLWIDAASTALDADGSQAKPYASLSGALAVAPAGARLALAAGTYTGPFTIGADVEIIGRCASMVRLEATGLTAVDATVETAFATVALRRLQIGGDAIGLRTSGGDVTISECWIHGARAGGILADGDLLIDRCLVDDVEDDASGVGGYALTATGTAAVTVQGSALHHFDRVGIAAYYDAVITARDVLVDNVGQPVAESSEPSAGALATFGGTVVLEDFASVGANHFGLYAYTGQLTAQRVVVVDTAADLEGYYGHGILAAEDAQVLVQSAVIAGNREVGLALDGPRTVIEIRRSLVADTLPRVADGGDGVGASALGGGRLVVLDSTFLGNRGGGIVAQDVGSSLSVTGTLVEGTLADPTIDGGFGVGIAPQAGSSAVVRNSALVGNAGIGLRVHTDSSGEMVDSLISGTVQLDGGGAGVEVLPNSELTMTRTRVEDSPGAAALVFGTATFVDTVLAATRAGHTLAAAPETADGLLAVSADVTVSRVVARNNARAGFLFHDATGAMGGSRSRSNGFGVVAQGAPLPAIGADNLSVDNGTPDGPGQPLLPVPSL